MFVWTLFLQIAIIRFYELMQEGFMFNLSTYFVVFISGALVIFFGTMLFRLVRAVERIARFLERDEKRY
jgi:hypothetical protein